MTAGMSHLIRNFVVQNPRQPRPLAGIAGERFLCGNRGEESVLDRVFRAVALLQPAKSVTQEILSVLLDAWHR